MKPAIWFKIWIYILQKVNHDENKYFERGTNLFTYHEIANNCRATYGQVEKCVKWLKQAGQLSTQKTTRGIVISVLQYNKYQRLDNYKIGTKIDSPIETESKQNRNRIDTINKNEKKCNNVSGANAPTPSQIAKEFFSDSEMRERYIAKLAKQGVKVEIARLEVKKFALYWTEPTKSGRKVRWETEKTFDIKRRLVTWMNNVNSYQKSYGLPKSK